MLCDCYVIACWNHLSAASLHRMFSDVSCIMSSCHHVIMSFQMSRLLLYLLAVDVALLGVYIAVADPNLQLVVHEVAGVTFAPPPLPRPPRPLSPCHHVIMSSCHHVIMPSPLLCPASFSGPVVVSCLANASTHCLLSKVGPVEIVH